KNLAMASGYTGRASACIAAFARARHVEAPKWAGQLLRQAGHHAAATRAYRYASLWFTTGEEWEWLAVAAYMAYDYETCAAAYDRAFALAPALATPASLNTLCDALQETREHARALPAAEQLASIAEGDAAYGPNAAFHRACALVGLGRHAEAVPFAKDAVARNTFPDNAKTFADVLALAEQGKPFDAVTLPSHAPHRRAARRLERGEFAAVSVLDKGAADWKLARVAFAACRFRSASENEPKVTPRLFEAALDLLGKTAGHAGVDASLCRLEALFAREQALFPVEPPCPLGARVPREEFARIFAQRSGKGGDAASAAAAAASAAAAAGDADPVVFPGEKLAKLSDWVRVMKGMQAGNVAGALESAGLDMAGYGVAAAAWGKRLAEDAVLAAKFQKLMTA
ncbi:MAG TPA: hypothetical protein VHB21_03960, partial [Minicystis sp.]|nr:hypothetical protein [Minicystis sp.]